MYVIVKWCCGVIAAFTTVGLLAASAVAAGHGISISPNVTIVAVVTIGASTVLAGMAWIVEEAYHRCVRRDIDPLVAEVVERSCAKLEKHFDEAIQSGLDRAQRYGMIREAAGRVNNGINRTVTSIRQRERD